MTERLPDESITRAQTGVPKAPITLEAPTANLGCSRFDILYAELKSNPLPVLPDKVYGEWIF